MKKFVHPEFKVEEFELKLGIACDTIITSTGEIITPMDPIGGDDDRDR